MHVGASAVEGVPSIDLISCGAFSFNDSLEMGAGPAFLDLRESFGLGSPASGGVSGVPARLELLSNVLDAVEDELALETTEAESSDGRTGVNLNAS